MAETSDAKKSSFSPGKKLPLLGIFDLNKNPWVRWGLPIATGMVAVLAYWFLS